MTGGTGKHLNYDVSCGEFLCPICERLSNSVLPLLPALPSLHARARPAQPADIR